MIRTCKTCGRRLRIKTVCVETGKKVCKKCCEMHSEGCDYHLFCWNKIV
jgi:hypothetical protein